MIAVWDTIAEYGGDARVAVRALLINIAFLEVARDRVLDLVSSYRHSEYASDQHAPRVAQTMLPELFAGQHPFGDGVTPVRMKPPMFAPGRITFQGADQFCELPQKLALLRIFTI
ncbi:MAG: hypothetical protein ACYC5H_06570 [Methylovirgula sp.]